MSVKDLDKKVLKIYYKTYFSNRGVILSTNDFSLGRHVVLDISADSDTKIGKRFVCEGYRNKNGAVCSKIAVQKGAHLTIGDNCKMINSVIWCSNEITIGDNVTISEDCLIMDTDFHSTDWRIRMRPDDCEHRRSKSIHIGNNVLIGRSCIIGKGIEIGDNSCVLSGSVVVKNIPEGETWGGNPAVKRQDK